MAAQNGEDAYVTLLLSDTYLPGALVLAHSLRDAGTTKKLAVLVTLDSVSAEVITQLKTVFDHVIPVPRVRNEKPANLYLMNRADLHSAFTKINLWKQTQFRKIVYIDADVVAYRAPDELFDLDHPFSAAPDIGWPDLFNTGVMALSPNLGDYYALVAMAERGISFDGADQGLLNMHFKNNYNRLSFTYNVTPSAHYQYVPAYRHFQSSINMVHFIGSEKPWALGREASSGGTPYDEMLGRWWAVYDRHYRLPSPPLTPTDASQGQGQHKVPEIIQYFVKGEFRPKTTTYVVPTGQPPLHQGRVTHDAYHHAPPPPSQPDYYHHQHHPHHHEQPHEHHHHEHPSQYHHEKSQARDFVPHPYIPPPVPSQSLSNVVEGTKAEAREEQVSAPQGGAPVVHHEEREHKPEPRPIEYSWDAQRQAPPADSKPEAMNFPQMHYEMSSDPAPFVPPPRYPSPPKNMWYEVPKEKPAPRTEKPRPIFPWEIEQPRPSRVFADDVYPSEPSLTEGSTVAPSGRRISFLESQTTMTEPSMTESSIAEQKSEPSSPATPTIRVTHSDPWASFTRVNAWDDDPAIDKYVGSMPLYRRHKSSGSLVGQTSPRAAVGSGAGSQSETSAGAEWRRRGSKLTDFPTAIERPSLPVTPAPIRRPKFWGAGGPGIDNEGEDDSKLPAADGVPQQSEWDPVARLQLLAKQQSELLLQKLGAGEVSGGGDAGGATGGEHSIPNRRLPFGSEDIVSPRYIARSSNVLSPQPVKPAGAGPQDILVQGQGESEATPRSTSATATETAKPAEPGSSIPEPSFHGPGAAWEKDEGYLEQSTALPPSEEEKDVLQT